MRRGVLVALLTYLVSGCSAAILASGTSEEEIVRVGSTKTELTQRLGEPLTVERLEPRRVWDEHRERLNMRLLVEPTWPRDADGKPQLQPPPDEATEKATYRFVGRLKKKHDVVEALSIGLTTFGLSEVIMTPAAIADRAAEREHLLIAWFDGSGRAIAYEWADTSK